MSAGLKHTSRYIDPCCLAAARVLGAHPESPPLPGAWGGAGRRLGWPRFGRVVGFAARHGERAELSLVLPIVDHGILPAGRRRPDGQQLAEKYGVPSSSPN